MQLNMFEQMGVNLTPILKDLKPEIQTRQTPVLSWDQLTSWARQEKAKTILKLKKQLP